MKKRHGGCWKSRKNNYGPVTKAITVEWREGAFVLPQSESHLSKAQKNLGLMNYSLCCCGDLKSKVVTSPIRLAPPMRRAYLPNTPRASEPRSNLLI